MRTEDGQIATQTEQPGSPRELEDGELADPDVQMTPRVVHALPQIARAPFVWPDPEATYTGEPLADNIHFQKSQRNEPLSPSPASITEPYTDAAFPRAVFESKDLLKNLDLKQVEFIEKASTVIAIIPFGAGQKFLVDNPKWNKEVEKFLKSLGFSGAEKLTVAPPTPRNKPDPKKAFAQPWTYILSNAPRGAQQLSRLVPNLCGSPVAHLPRCPPLTKMSSLGSSWL